MWICVCILHSNAYVHMYFLSNPLFQQVTFTNNFVTFRKASGTEDGREFDALVHIRLCSQLYRISAIQRATLFFIR